MNNQNPSAPVTLIRSALFIPASNVKALSKAFTLEHDICIFDLEASVADSAKAEARENLQVLFADQVTDYKKTVVRINQLSSKYINDDIKMLSLIKPNAVLLPMVQTEQDIKQLSVMLLKAGINKIDLWAMIETPKAVLFCQEIAALKEQLPNLSCFVFGSNDLSLLTNTRQQTGRLPMLSWISHIILAARAYGIDILDSVFADIKNPTDFYQECQDGVAFGMDGKTLIHPSQITDCNLAFSPKKHELATAHAIVDAFSKPDNADKGALLVEGKMVERLHETIAKNLLAKQAAIDAKLPHHKNK